MKWPNDEMNYESCTQASKDAETKTLNDSQDKSEAAGKPSTAKVASRNPTCATVVRWKYQDLAQYEAVSWLTYDSKKTKRGQYYTALKCKICSQLESVVKNRPKFWRTFIDGSTNFRLSNVVDHATSDTHKLALSLYNKQ